MKLLITILTLMNFLTLGCKATEELSQSEIQQNSKQPREKFSTNSMEFIGDDSSNPVLISSIFNPNNLVDGLTLSFWFKMNSASPSGIYILSNLSATNHLRILWDSGTRIHFYIEFDNLGLALRGEVFAEVANVQEWNHIVLTYDFDGSSLPTPNRLRAYLNGNLSDESFQGGSQFTVSPSFGLRLDHGFGYLSSGALDEMSLWARAITEDEVKKIYNLAMPGDLSQSVPDYSAWWRMGENSVYPLLSDETGNFDFTMFLAGTQIVSETAFQELDPFGGEPGNTDPLNEGEAGDNAEGGGSGSDPFAGGSSGYQGDLSGGGQAGGEFP